MRLCPTVLKSMCSELKNELLLAKTGKKLQSKLTSFGVYWIKLGVKGGMNYQTDYHDLDLKRKHPVFVCWYTFQALGCFYVTNHTLRKCSVYFTLFDISLKDINTQEEYTHFAIEKFLFCIEFY